MANTFQDGFADLDRRFLSQAMRTALLTQEKEYDLIGRWRGKGDQRALDELLKAYYRMVIAQAAKFRQYNLPAADLVQEGNLGLLQAASRFDLERGVRFSTYAMWWVRSAMQEYVLRNWSIVKAGSSASQKALFFKLRWLRARIEGREPDLAPSEVRDRIAAALKVSSRDVETMSARLGGRDTSLDAPVGGEEGDDSLGDFLVDDGPDPEEIVTRRHDGALQRSWLHDALAELNPREQMIVQRRQLDDDGGATLEELGGTLGVTKERVRQIEAKALDKLRDGVLKRAKAPPRPALEERELEPCYAC